MVNGMPNPGAKPGRSRDQRNQLDFSSMEERQIDTTRQLVFGVKGKRMRKQTSRAKTTNATFSIGPENQVRPCSTGVPADPTAVIFSTERELLMRTNTWPGSRLVEVWNRLPQVIQVTRFTNRQTAIQRIWRAIRDGKFMQAPSAPDTSAKKAQRSDTKTAQIIGLLQQPAGATLRSIMDLTGWQSHSVRGFLSAQLSKKRGLHVTSFTRNGERVYRIRVYRRET